MATPTFVKFSRILHPMKEALIRLRSNVFDPWNVIIESTGQLRASHSKLDGGLELVDDKLYPCDTEVAALALGPNWDSVGLVYKVPVVPCNVFLYLFDMNHDGFSCTLSFDSSLVYFRSDDFNDGGWLKGFLAAMTAGLDADVCGYGPDNSYAVKHETVDPEQVISRLRNGDLLTIGNPVFHAFSSRVIDLEEIEELFQTRPKYPELQFSVTLKGYYILSAIP